MNARDLNRYKEMLLAKRRELVTARAGTESPAPSSGGDKGDLVDHATAALEAEVQVRLRETDSKLLRAIDEALGRIEHNVFGVCQACMKPISAARLDAVPWSRLCRECKEQQQA
ncbi:MAG: TraR/DksA family transcriptional regulator [Terriglobia bacterium]